MPKMGKAGYMVYPGMLKTAEAGYIVYPGSKK